MDNTNDPKPINPGTEVIFTDDSQPKSHPQEPVPFAKHTPVQPQEPVPPLAQHTPAPSAVKTTPEHNDHPQAKPDQAKPAKKPAPRASDKKAEHKTPQPPASTSKPDIDVTPKVKSRFQTALWLFIPVLIIAAILFMMSFLYPETVSILLNGLIIFILIIFIAFVILGFFVIIGLRKQVKTIISLLFEGPVKYIEAVKAIKSLWETLVRIVQEIIITLSPAFAIFLGIVIYYLIMYIFRVVGKNSDVAIFTVVITVSLGCINALLGIARAKEPDLKSFKGRLSQSFGRAFIDSVEVVTLVLFLTLDWRNPFFLPQSLHVPLRAEMFGIDLMKRGITGENVRTTFLIAGTAILIEIIRKIYRVIAAAAIRYKELRMNALSNGTLQPGSTHALTTLQQAIRISVKDNLDDLTKFLGFTTVLVIAFFFFPRLKLVSLMFYNLTSLVWDFIYPQRAIMKAKSEDLLSRVIAKVFKL